MDFLSGLFGLKNESVSASASMPRNGLAAKLNTPAPQLGGRRRRTHKRRSHKRKTHKRTHH